MSRDVDPGDRGIPARNRHEAEQLRPHLGGRSATGVGPAPGTQRGRALTGAGTSLYLRRDRPRLSDPCQRLSDALVALGGDRSRLASCRSTPWASATFAGMLATVRLSLTSLAADRLAEALDSHEFMIPRHLIADIAIVQRTDEGDGWTIVSIEALVLEAG